VYIFEVGATHTRLSSSEDAQEVDKCSTIEEVTSSHIKMDSIKQKMEQM